MSEVMRKSIIDIDLTKPLRMEQGRVLLASRDDNANVFGVNVYNGGEAVSLAGCTVVGYLTRHDDGHVEKLIGSTSRNRALVALNANCYEKTGYCTLTIKIKNASGFRVTVRAVNCYVYATSPDDYVDDDSDEPVAVTLTVDAEGNGTITGAVLTVDEDGNATLIGYTPSVDEEGGGTVG